jgi:hypothetical protein
MSLRDLFKRHKKPEAPKKSLAETADGGRDPRRFWPQRHPKLATTFAAIAVAVPWTTVMNNEPVFRPITPAMAITLEAPAPEAPAPKPFRAFFHWDNKGNIRFAHYEQLPENWRRVFEGSSDVKGFPGASGKALYEQLPPIPRACVLNLFAKSEATALPDGSTVLDHLQSLHEIRQDRIFVLADGNMAPDLDASAALGTFYHRNAVDSMFHSGHGDFIKYASYKTHDPRGNLDITMTHDTRDGANQWMAEVDIDYFQRGLRHFFFEVTYNHFAHARTNPFEVEKILMKKQGINPGYKGPS